MPHATSDEMMSGMDEQDTIQRFLGAGQTGDDVLHDRAFDQRDKAEDAVDYEDISDEDDLPDEELATQRIDDQDSGFYSQVPGAIGGSPVVPHTNGYHHDVEPSSDELFGSDDHLFGDRGSSPEQQRQPPRSAPLPPRSGGLALPTMTGLALPTGPLQYPPPPRPHAQYSPTSLSPPAFREDAYRDPSLSDMEASDEDNANDPEALQRRLFRTAKRKQAGGEVEERREPISMVDFYSFFPEYEFDQNPKFLELFPQRPAEYRGKAPLKPPKPVHPTKISLELLPDQERSFKSAAGTKDALESSQNLGIICFEDSTAAQDDSDDDLAFDDFGGEEVIGGVKMADLAVICEPWDVPSIDSASLPDDEEVPSRVGNGDWDLEDQTRPSKKRKYEGFDKYLNLSTHESYHSLEDPECATQKVAKAVTLDLNDPNLMIDEHAPQARRGHRIFGDAKHNADIVKDFTRRYNISNDMAYDLLKENHHHKIRSTLGNMVIEHSLPAHKLQYPFYKTILEPRAKRTFHRPALDLRDARREYRFQRPPKGLKKKNVRGRDIKELFDTSDKLSLNDNASVLLLEYSEEAPTMMSNFGMGSRLINYYRKRNVDDQERPRRELGETHVLLTQDKSPFANFGHVDPGEMVPTLQNALFRAPVFQHSAKPADFLIAISSTYEGGSRMYLRNVDNLHTVGQQLPSVEVPGEHSRKVTDAAKRRLRALAYRIYTKSQDVGRRDKQLDNATLMPHLLDHDMPQTRSKMREFMKYERLPNKDGGVWVPLPGVVVPDADTLRGWIKPEDICVLDSMQVGVQHLEDLGLKDTKGQDDKDENRDIDDKDNIEIQLAPWRTTKNFIAATQGKAMLGLHGDGDPTGRGEGFSFVRTSMKGGFRVSGESVEDKIDAKKRRENGGHSYNVAKQQKVYDDTIRTIWDKQKQSLTSEMVGFDTEMDDDFEAEPESPFPYGRGGTPRSSMGTPAAIARRDDETMTQASRGSAARESDRILVIERAGGRDPIYGMELAGKRKEVITDPRIIKEYKRRRRERLRANMDFSEIKMTGEAELDAIKREHIEEEVARIQRNIERREARERQKGRTVGASPSAAGSPGAPSDVDGNSSAIPGTADGTPQKGRGRHKEGTARKCANCGQVGHIKTNRKSVYTLHCVFCGHEESGNLRGKDAATAGAKDAAPSHMQHDFSTFKL